MFKFFFKTAFVLILFNSISSYAFVTPDSFGFKTSVSNYPDNNSCNSSLAYNVSVHSSEMLACNSLGTYNGTYYYYGVDVNYCRHPARPASSDTNCLLKVAVTCPVNTSLSLGSCVPNSGYEEDGLGGVRSSTPVVCTLPYVRNATSNTCELPACPVGQQRVPPSITCTNICSKPYEFTASNPSNPCQPNSILQKALGGAIVGLGIVVAGVGAIAVGPLAVGAGAAIAGFGAIIGLSANGVDPDTGNASLPSAPLTVRLDPKAPPADPTKPSVDFNPDTGKFEKGGSGATGTWEPSASPSGGASGGWSAPTDRYGTSIEIAPDGKSVTAKTPADGGGAVVQTVSWNDDTKDFTVTKSVPQQINYGDGTSQVGAVASSADFSSSGAEKSRTLSVMPSVNSAASPAVSVVALLPTGSGVNGSGGFTAGAGGTDTGSGIAGGCGSLSCESTQKQVLGALTASFNPSGTKVGLSDSVNETSLKNSSLLNAPSGITGFSSFQFPEHTSTCPVLKIPFNGVDRVMNSHCALADSYRPQLVQIMNLVWLLLAFFIVIGA